MYLRTGQTRRPFGTSIWRVHRILGYGGYLLAVLASSSPPCLLPLALMPLTAGRHVAQASSPVLDPTWPPQVLTDRETVWDLLQEGP